MRLPADRHHHRIDRSRIPVHLPGILAQPGGPIRIQPPGNLIDLFDAESGKRIA
jgi:hypothetical protein